MACRWTASSAGYLAEKEKYWTTCIVPVILTTKMNTKGLGAKCTRFHKMHPKRAICTQMHPAAPTAKRKLFVVSKCEAKANKPVQKCAGSFLYFFETVWAFLEQLGYKAEYERHQRWNWACTQLLPDAFFFLKSFRVIIGLGSFRFVIEIKEKCKSGWFVVLEKA